MEDIINEWNRIAATKHLKSRDFDINKITEASKNRISAVTGIRRSGKSSLLMILYRTLLESNKKAFYLNLEDNRLKIQNILDELLKRTSEGQWLLLDEITSINGWENWAHRINEMKTVHLIVSSSLNKLSRFPPKQLRGRISYSELFPLSFSEFLKFKKIELTESIQGIGAIERALEEFLIYGGFPEVVLSENKVEILQNYLNSIVSLDISSFTKISFRVISDFVDYLITSTIFSASKAENVMKTIGHKIGKHALLELEQLFEATYLEFFVPVFSAKIKDEKFYPRKIYTGDTGFIYALTGKIDLGRLYENSVFIHLRRKLQPLEFISYYKSPESEVDFVIRKGTNVQKLMQVCYEIKDKKTEKRELEALLEAANDFKIDGKKGELLIITKDTQMEQEIQGKKITYKKLWKWLLE